MNIEEFEKYINSIGFKTHDWYYVYEKYRIDLLKNSCYYDYYNGSEWVFSIPLNDLTPIEEEFKQKLRSIKLKGLLR